MSQTSITKQAAAQRSLDTAIRMLFLHAEDLIAIHTLAAAARTVIQDLAESRGVGNTTETETALEKFYRDQYGLDPSERRTASHIKWRARQLEKHWRTKSFRNAASNFLKHADKDGGLFLNFEEINLLWIIFHAINLWINLGFAASLEMSVFGQWIVFVADEAGPAHGKPIEHNLGFGGKLLKYAYLRERRRMFTAIEK